MTNRPYQPKPIIQPQRTQFLANFKLPDVSFWQDDPTTAQPINFGKMSGMTRGVIIRAGQGTYEDRVFKTSWSNAKQAGLIRGSYWFYDSRVNAKRQAEKFVEVLSSDPGEMEMWCDFEDRYGGAYTGWRHWFDFMERIKTLMPEKKTWSLHRLLLLAGICCGGAILRSISAVDCMVQPDRTTHSTYLGRLDLLAIHR